MNEALKRELEKALQHAECKDEWTGQLFAPFMNLQFAPADKDPVTTKVTLARDPAIGFWGPGTPVVISAEKGRGTARVQVSFSCTMVMSEANVNRVQKGSTEELSAEIQFRYVESPKVRVTNTAVRIVRENPVKFRVGA